MGKPTLQFVVNVKTTFLKMNFSQIANISDCTAPFEIGVITDDKNDSEDGKTDNEAMSRGNSKNITIY